MKTVIIPDVHGRDYWKQIVNKETDFDEVVFLGDYWDSFNISFEDQLNNFLDILEFKRINKAKVKLLIGNHEYHYLPRVICQYSGYQNKYADKIKEVLEEAIKEFDFSICYYTNNYLISHAGVSKNWYKYEIGNIPTSMIEIQNNINIMYKHNPFAFDINYLDISGYGDEVHQSPIWIRPTSLFFSRLSNINQIVGHTEHPNIVIPEYNDKLIFVDVHDKNKQYLKLENNEPFICTF